MSVDISLNELATAEKLALMERLWVDLSRQPQDVPSPAWHGVVLDEHREAVRQGRTTFVAWEEARQRRADQAPRIPVVIESEQVQQALVSARPTRLRGSGTSREVLPSTPPPHRQSRHAGGDRCRRRHPAALARRCPLHRIHR